MMEELRDIKGLVEIMDYSFYYLLGIVGVTVIVLMVLAVLLYKYLTKKELLTQKKVAMELLEKFEFGDAKQSAYEFSHLAQYAVNETQRRELEQLLAELEPYKFKKEVPELDDALKAKMQAFAKEVRRG
jgi:hypothetical protein